MKQMPGNPSLSHMGFGIPLHKIWVLKTQNVCRRLGVVVKDVGVASSIGATEEQVVLARRGKVSRRKVPEKQRSWSRGWALHQELRTRMSPSLQPLLTAHPPS